MTDQLIIFQTLPTTSHFKHLNVAQSVPLWHNSFFIATQHQRLLCRSASQHPETCMTFMILCLPAHRVSYTVFVVTLLTSTNICASCSFGRLAVWSNFYRACESVREKCRLGSLISAGYSPISADNCHRYCVWEKKSICSFTKEKP